MDSGAYHRSTAIPCTGLSRVRVDGARRRRTNSHSWREGYCVHSAGYVIAINKKLVSKLVLQSIFIYPSRLNAQISMPPARLPARIDRSGLGGGSFFSPAPAAGSALATGAVAAATEAIADSSVIELGVTQVSSWGPVGRSPIRRMGGWAVLCRVATGAARKHWQDVRVS